MAKLPPPPKEIPVNRSLDVLAPRFRARVQMVVAGMVGLGLDAYVFETLRTNERQNYLYGFGRRYDDGRGVVTHSIDADESWHHYGLAVDIISESKGWDAPPKFWRVLGETARAAVFTGVVTGSHFRIFHTCSGGRRCDSHRLLGLLACLPRVGSRPSGKRLVQRKKRGYPGIPRCILTPPN
jgi:hypothetical protein